MVVEAAPEVTALVEQAVKEEPAVVDEEAIFMFTITDIRLTMDEYQTQRIYSAVSKWTARATLLMTRAIIKLRGAIGYAQEMGCRLGDIATKLLPVADNV